MVTSPTGKRTAWLILAGVLILACMCSPAAWFGNNRISPEEPTPGKMESDPEILPTPMVVAPVGPTPEPQPEKTSLTTEVPWLVISTTEGLWAANMDGSNLQDLLARENDELFIQWVVSSPARKVAVLTSRGDYYHDLLLKIVSLPDLELTASIELIKSEYTPDPDRGPGDPLLEAVRAISEQRSIAWSPDGSQIAFTALLEKPNAEIYIYNLVSHSTKRLSEDDGQDYWPIWSPDGKQIIYLEAEGFGTGAGQSMNGIWTADPEGSGRKLLTPINTAGESIYGWISDTQVALASWNAMSGMNSLRVIDVTNSKETLLSKGPVYGAAVTKISSTMHGVLMWGDEDGLHLLTDENPTPTLITSELVSTHGTPEAIRWDDESAAFIVHFEDGNLSTFMWNGADRQDGPANPSLGRLDVSAFGLIWGWTDDGGEDEGAWISGPGLTTTKIYTGSASTPMWNIDNDLFFFDGSDVYKATFNSFYSDATRIGSVDGRVLNASWVGFYDALDAKYGP